MDRYGRIAFFSMSEVLTVVTTLLDSLSMEGFIGSARVTGILREGEDRSLWQFGLATAGIILL